MHMYMYVQYIYVAIQCLAFNYGTLGAIVGILFLLYYIHMYVYYLTHARVRSFKIVATTDEVRPLKKQQITLYDHYQSHKLPENHVQLFP